MTPPPPSSPSARSEALGISVAMATKKKHSSSSSGGGTGSGKSSVEPLLVPLIHDSLTFSLRQTKGLKEMERQAEAEMKRRRRDWERDVDRMREEFLRLYPVPMDERHHQPHDPLVAKRRGSTDILDAKKMQTMITEQTAADAERKFRLRFDVSGFDVETIEVLADAQRIVVQASKTETVKGRAVKRQFIRKIQNPIEVDTDKLTSHLTTDGILVVEALLQPKLHLQNKVSDPSSTASPHHLRRRTSSQSTPGTPSHNPAAAAEAGTSEEVDGTVQNPEVKLGVPVFRDERGCRRLFLVVYIGTLFRPKDVTVQVIRDNRIVVKARHEEISSERLVKGKFSKEFELAEKIETGSVRGGIDDEGRLVVGAFVKGHGKDRVDEEPEEEAEEFEPKSDLLQCNVLNLSSFPPTMPASAVILSSNGTS